MRALQLRRLVQVLGVLGVLGVLAVLVVRDSLIRHPRVLVTVPLFLQGSYLLPRACEPPYEVLDHCRVPEHGHKHGVDFVRAEQVQRAKGGARVEHALV